MYRSTYEIIWRRTSSYKTILFRLQHSQILKMTPIFATLTLQCQCRASIKLFNVWQQFHDVTTFQLFIFLELWFLSVFLQFLESLFLIWNQLNMPEYKLRFSDVYTSAVLNFLSRYLNLHILILFKMSEREQWQQTFPILNSNCYANGAK